MKINIFMATAGDQWEKQVLKNMGAGIEAWIRTLAEPWRDNIPVRIGRWSQFDIPRDATMLEYVCSETYESCDVAIMFGSESPPARAASATHRARP